MNRALGSVILGLSGAGFPLTQAAIRRFGHRGAVLTVGVTGALLARDVALIAGGAPKQLPPGPRALLLAEAATAGLASGVGIMLLRDPEVRAARQPGWNVSRQELVRRIAIGALFGLLTMRVRVSLAPGSGLRPGADHP